MNERSDRPAAPQRLVLDFGDVVEMDGSTVFDPSGRKHEPAVVLRVAPHRAALLGRTLLAYTRIARLACTEDALEYGPGWALTQLAAAAGHVDHTAGPPAKVTSARRAAAAAVLRESAEMDDMTMIAVVDAAARWLDEPDGADFAWALLTAAIDGRTGMRVYEQLYRPAGDQR